MAIKPVEKLPFKAKLKSYGGVWQLAVGFLVGLLD